MEIYIGEPEASKILKYTCSVAIMFVSFRHINNIRSTISGKTIK